MGFGDKLRTLRMQQDMSQMQLSKKLGYQNNSYVCDAEHNRFIPSEEKLQAWAKILGISWEKMQDLLLETELEDLGINDPGFTMMFKDIPSMTYEEKQSILVAYQAVLRERAKKAEK